jgi:hypothetical protein
MKENRVIDPGTMSGSRPDFSHRIPAPVGESGHDRFNGSGNLSDQALRYFIRSCTTSEFIRCDSLWTLNFSEALDFLSLERAVYWGRKELKTPFEVIKAGQNQFLDSIEIAVLPLLWPKASDLASGSRLRRPARNSALRAGPVCSAAPTPPLTNTAPAKRAAMQSPNGSPVLNVPEIFA